MARTRLNSDDDFDAVPDIAASSRDIGVAMSLAKTPEQAETIWRSIPADDLIDRWAQYAESRLAERSVKRYRAALVEFVDWLAAQDAILRNRGINRPVGITDVARAQIVVYMDYLERSRVILDPRDGHTYHSPLSASSRKNTLAALRHFYRWMIHADPFREKDPTAAIDRPTPKTTTKDVLTSDELRELLYYNQGHPRSRIQCWLMVYTAARVEELCNLRWEHVNFENDTIRLYGKGDKERVIDLVADLRPELIYWQKLQRGTAQGGKFTTPEIKAALEDKQTAFVLMSKNGERLWPTTIWRSLKRRAYQAGVKPLDHPGFNKHGRTKDLQSEVSPHMLRRSAATYLLEQGVHIDVISDILGHADISTTKRHYLNPSDERRTAAMAKLRFG
jgi:site-specific recombinase XerD